MQDIMLRLVDVPLARMFVLASIIFLLLAVLGKIEGKIEPGRIGRIGAIIVGMLLLSVGLAMHFNETGDLRDKLLESMSPSRPAAVRMPDDAPGATMAGLAMTAPDGGSAGRAGAGEKTENVKPVIKVVSGTYGSNCGARTGNATAQISRACDGQVRCEYKMDPASLEDPAPNCAKNFTAEWKCGTGATVYAISIPAAAARDEPLKLVCLAQ